jgi:hypothetical protein
MRSSKTPQKRFGENPKKLRENQTFFLSSFPVDFVLSRFGRFSAKGAQKHHKNNF